MSGLARKPRFDYLATLLIAHLTMIGCGESPSGLQSPSSVVIVRGEGQSSIVNQVVEVPPAVRVQDKDGIGVSGILVRFRPGSNGGTVEGDSVFTDARGVAGVTRWTAGTIAGTDSLIIMVSGASTATVVPLIVRADRAFTITPDGQQYFAGPSGQAITPAPAVVVRDEYGNAVPSTVVSFTVVAGGGMLRESSSLTDRLGTARIDGWQLGPTDGLNTVVATIVTGRGTTLFAHGFSSPPQLSPASPTDQDGYLEFPVAQIPRVLVRDVNGDPLPNIPVLFALAGASDDVISAPVGVSDAAGFASPGDWWLGASLPARTVVAQLQSGRGGTVSFRATGAAARFVIRLVYLSTVTPDQRDAFVAAARRWMGVIVAGLPRVRVTLPAGACAGGSSPYFDDEVRDVVIFASVGRMDGVGGVVASAGPCVRRSPSHLTAVGQVRMDVADAEILHGTGRLVPTLIHEMGHVLGFGTAWLENGLTTDWNGMDPAFIGKAALAVWPSLAIEYGGRLIPLETLGGFGTRDVHWRESVLGAELMTAYLEGPGIPMPLSQLTVAAMEDLGYEVEISAADPFETRWVSGARSSQSRMHLNERIETPLLNIAPSADVPSRMKPD